MRTVRAVALVLGVSFFLQSALSACGRLAHVPRAEPGRDLPGKSRHPVERRWPQGRLAKADQHGLQFLRRQRRQGLHAGRARNRRQFAGNLPGPGRGNRQGTLVRRYRQGRRLQRRRYGRRRRRSAVHAHRERRQGLPAHARSGRPLPRRRDGPADLETRFDETASWAEHPVEQRRLRGRRRQPGLRRRRRAGRIDAGPEQEHRRGRLEDRRRNGSPTPRPWWPRSTTSGR